MDHYKKAPESKTKYIALLIVSALGGRQHLSGRYSEMRPRGNADCERRPAIIIHHQSVRP